MSNSRKVTLKMINQKSQDKAIIPSPWLKAYINGRFTTRRKAAKFFGIDETVLSLILRNKRSCSPNVIGSILGIADVPFSLAFDIVDNISLRK